MRSVAIFGSTGSIGTQALEIIKRNSHSLGVALLSCNKNLTLIKEQMDEFNPQYVILPDTDSAHSLSEQYNNITFFFGENGLCQAASECEYDLMLNSLIGISGFLPTYNCLLSGRDVALANKETLVAGGSIIMNLAHKKGLSVIPVDSEHSAIFQCLQGNTSKIKKITLTASGGAFRGKKTEELDMVTSADALRHPNWSMGKKITIDSATLMNKGFEVIEAKWLFDLSPEKIEVLLHPESIVHSMVEFEDNSTLAQLGQPDMAIPISYAFSYPDRWETTAKPIDLVKNGALNFSKPDTETFKCLELALESLKKGDSYPVVLNAANEVLVEYFLREKIGFLDIGDMIETILSNHKSTKPVSPENVLEVDIEARRETLELINLNNGGTN